MIQISTKEDALEQVRKNGYNLDCLSIDFSDDIDVVLEATKKNAGAFQFAHNSLKKDPNAIIDIYVINGAILEYMDEDLRADKKFALKLCKVHDELNPGEYDRADNTFLIDPIQENNCCPSRYFNDEIKEICYRKNSIRALESAIHYEDLQNTLMMKQDTTQKQRIKI